jgi:hypothetical protein
MTLASFGRIFGSFSKIDSSSDAGDCRR